MAEEVRVAQEAHEAADCKINDKEFSHPDVDCGHAVNEGPGVQGYADLNMYDEKDPHGKVIVAGAPKHNMDQDVAAGPGVQGSADLNIYDEKDPHGKVVVAGAPKHNMDQDVEHGPGVK